MATKELERLRLGYGAAYSAYLLWVRQICDAAQRGAPPTEEVLRGERAAFIDLTQAREALFRALIGNSNAA